MLRSNPSILRFLILISVFVPASFYQTTKALKTEPVSYELALGANVIANPNYFTSCLPRGYDNSVECADAVLAAINNARAQEGISAMVLPANFLSLSPAEQLFVVINLERTARGLPPASATTTQLNSAAQVGAETNSDPQISNATFSWGSDWAWGEPNALATDYVWMYDDGFGSPNIACASPNSAGCWGHRKNILVNFGARPTYAGVGYKMDGNQMNSISLLLADSLASSSDQISLDWNQLEAGTTAPKPAVTKEVSVTATSPVATLKVAPKSNVPSYAGQSSPAEAKATPQNSTKAVPTVPANAYSFGSVGWMIERYRGIIAFFV